MKTRSSNHISKTQDIKNTCFLYASHRYAQSWCSCLHFLLLHLQIYCVSIS